MTDLMEVPSAELSAITAQVVSLLTNARRRLTLSELMDGLTNIAYEDFVETGSWKQHVPRQLIRAIAIDGRIDIVLRAIDQLKRERRIRQCLRLRGYRLSPWEPMVPVPPYEYGIIAA